MMSVPPLVNSLYSDVPKKRPFLVTPCALHRDVWVYRGRRRCRVCGHWVRKRPKPSSAWDVLRMHEGQKQTLLAAFVARETALEASRETGIDLQKVGRFFRLVRAACFLPDHGLGAGLTTARIVAERGFYVRARGESRPRPRGIWNYVCISVRTRGQTVLLGLPTDRDLTALEKYLEENPDSKGHACRFISWQAVSGRSAKRWPGQDGWIYLPLHIKSRKSKGGERFEWAFVPAASDRSEKILKPRARKDSQARNHAEAYWLHAKWLLSQYGTIPLKFLSLYLAETAWRYNRRRVHDVELEQRMRKTTPADVENWAKVR
jgi:hypothetical protein